MLGYGKTGAIAPMAPTLTPAGCLGLAGGTGPVLQVASANPEGWRGLPSGVAKDLMDAALPLPGPLTPGCLILDGLD